MAYPSSYRKKARELRLVEGLSAKSIGEILGVTKGTAHGWIRDIELTPEQKGILKYNSVKNILARNDRIKRPTIKCFNCEKETRNHKYCSQYCANKINNETKRHIYPARYICECGEKKDHRANRCHACKTKYTLIGQLNRTLKDTTGKGNARVKWAHVRELGKKVLEYFGIEKSCNICEFDVLVDACHITAIKNFSEDALLWEVNAIENLVYLCPNHHKMMDKNLLSKEEVIASKKDEPMMKSLYSSLSLLNKEVEAELLC